MNIVNQTRVIFLVFKHAKHTTSGSCKHNSNIFSQSYIKCKYVTALLVMLIPLTAKLCRNLKTMNTGCNPFMEELFNKCRPKCPTNGTRSRASRLFQTENLDKLQPDKFYLCK